jgi:methylenetetrahydrofolate reductase (NADPH)
LTAADQTAALPAQAEAQRRIVAFMAQASFETARLAPSDVDALAGLARGTPIYVSAVPARPLAEQIDTAARIGAAGLEPVPHVAARSFASVAALDRHLGQLTEASVRRVLIIGGDQASPAGPFHRALEVIESGLLQVRGIGEIAIAGYPDGHRRLGVVELDRALATKLEAAAATGLLVHIVTQFGFAAGPIRAWIARLRNQGIDHKVRVGFAGPATLAGLLGYARICGVTASAQGLARQAGLAKPVFGMMAPDAVLRPIAEAAGELGDIAPHFYAFGGLAAAVRWARAAAAGRIRLDHADGFTVEPP